MEELSASFGPPGFEQDVANIMIRQLTNIAELKRDKLGGVIFQQEGKKNGLKIMVEAHMDEIGFMVKDITEKGYLKLMPLGCWSTECILGQELIVRCKKKDVVGILANIPYHIAFVQEPILNIQELIKEVPFNLFLDVGAQSREEVIDTIGVFPGDPVVPIPHFSVMENKELIIGKAWDDRVGVGLVIKLIELLANNQHNNIVYGVGSTQEEISPYSWRGVKPALEVANPELAICLEAAPAHNLPWHSERENRIQLGRGPIVLVYEPVMIPNAKLKEYVIKLAEDQNIPFQLFVSEELGSNAKVIHLHNQGVPTITIGIPTRYVHTCHGIINRVDFDHALQLLYAVCTDITQSIYKKIINV